MVPATPGPVVAPDGPAATVPAPPSPTHPTGPEPAPAARWAVWWLRLSVLGFVLLSITYVATRSPWWDEGLYADVARQFALHGELRSGAMSEPGTFGHDPLPEMTEHAYWTTPLYPVTLGLWFRAVGDGLVQMRALSLLFGLALLWSWWHVVRQLTGSRTTAHVATGLIALSSHVLWIASIGRMETMSVALLGAGMAAYLHWRERALTRAVAASSALFMLAGLAHPMALVTALGFLAVVLVRDWRRLRIRHVALAAIVALALATPWLLYMMQDVEAFRAQWGANARVRGGGLQDPLRYLLSDLTGRYLHLHFTMLHGINKLRIMELVALVACAAIGLLVPAIRRTRGFRAFLLFAAVSWAALALLDGSRFVQYMAYVFPVYVCVAAVVLTDMTRRSTAWRVAAGVLAAAIIAPGAGGIAIRALRSPYHHDYLPAVAAVRELQRPGVRIVAPSEMGFALGFEGAFVDDMQLRTPADVYVQGELYLTDNPGAWQTRVRETLARDFALVYENPRFRVFARRDAMAREP